MNAEVGKSYEVKVVKILPIGAVVEYMNEPGTTDLVHISNIADCFVKDVSDFVTEGNIYVADCEASDKRPYQLSFVHLNLKSKQPRRERYSSNEKYSEKFEKMISNANDDFNSKARFADKRIRRK